MKLEITTEVWRLRHAFEIARGAKTQAETVCVSLSDGGAKGRGECVPYARYGQSPASVVAQLEGVRGSIESGLSRADLQALLPAGAARNALDCALWDLDAKRSGKPVWELAGLDTPRPLRTAFTITLNTPDAMAEAARDADQFRLLKVKIGGADDLDRLAAIARARPDARLIVDANEGLPAALLPTLLDQARALNIDVIEQPFGVDQDALLGQVAAPVALCADESFHTSADIDQVLQSYDAVNIKLDKAGGLTEGLKAVRAARAAGLRIMVGCMVGTSLGTAPALLLAQMADWVDLDGPLWLAQDVAPGLIYEGGLVHPADPELWG